MLPPQLALECLLLVALGCPLGGGAEVTRRAVPECRGPEPPVRLAETGGTVNRTDNRVVDGVEGYVLTGSLPGKRFHYEFGTQHLGHSVLISVDYRKPPPDPTAVVESVLASVGGQR